jgi:hypothetical protein
VLEHLPSQADVPQGGRPAAALADGLASHQITFAGSEARERAGDSRVCYVALQRRLELQFALNQRIHLRGLAFHIDLEIHRQADTIFGVYYAHLMH